MVTVTVKQIIGRAGTGKTTYAKRVAEHYIKRRKTVYCLSLTHNSVENMRKRGFPSECKFSTIHSFFRINYSGEVIGCYKSFDVIIIDEFSLISSELLVTCIKSIYGASKELAIADCQVYLVGDPLQIGAVNPDETITFSSLDRAIKLLPIKDLPVEKVMPIIRHWSRLCINHPYIKDLTEKSLTLTTNHRSDDSIMEIVNNTIMNGEFKDILLNLITTDEVVKNIRENGYTVIASRYDILHRLNERVRIEADSLSYHDWYYIKGEDVYITVSTNTLFNGERVRLVDAQKTSITIDGPNGRDVITDLFIKNTTNDKANHIPLAIPTYLYTFHKSQGLEFDNVAICIDDLFEFPMLYTGITRARKNVKFFTMKSLLVTEIENIIGKPFNRAAIDEFYNNHSTDNDKQKSLNKLLMGYINSGSIEINAINGLYIEPVK